jgi:hypothetical protein
MKHRGGEETFGSDVNIKHLHQILVIEICVFVLASVLILLERRLLVSQE